MYILALRQPNEMCAHDLLASHTLLMVTTSERSGTFCFSNQNDLHHLRLAPAEVAVPCGHVLVGEPGGHVKHDDGALAMYVVAIA